MQQIKNIIFDLGGIFLNIDFKKTEVAFAKLGVADFSRYITQHTITDTFELLETGKISPEEFYDRFKKDTGVAISTKQIEDAWNALLLDFPIERIEWLDDIRSRYNVFLYSNTNQIHYDAFIEMFRQQTGKDNFNRYFIKAYYSHELGLRKPYPNSYLYILKEQQLVAQETLFIDDTIKNIEGAKEAGLQTIHLHHPKTVLDLEL
ncbi:MAG TPA: HAD family phosphatase [Panacibacter sp.]|nr:HAD family phosphatase [Panacibacter sp.]